MLRIRPGTNQGSSVKAKRDGWDKADIVAKFLSSVVIAVIGILITWSIQQTQIQTNESIARAQIEAAKAKAQDDRRYQESQVTVQLVNHLISTNGTQRQIAIVALKQSVPGNVYDSILQILAQVDQDASVRSTAIVALASSRSPNATTTLSNIANDGRRSQLERTLASQAATQGVLTRNTEPSTYTFIASLVGQTPVENEALGGGAFTYALIEGLSGKADSQKQGALTASELSEYLQKRTASLTGGRQIPFLHATGPVTQALFSTQRRGNVHALVVGVSNYRTVPALRYSASDANAIAEVLKKNGASVKLLMDATGDQISSELKALWSLDPDTTVVLYFSGHSVTVEGRSFFLGVDATDASHTWVPVDEVLSALARTSARATWIFFETSTRSVFSAQSR